ncbi:receptor-type guanylate cyclase gcy-28-like [Ptychodera flava]|uniref:receptor-type guanylate cyclase gcy-28-like n=1 Tax=Ptychodera flava TaxID=63121 RepID=UPI00396A1ED2
MWNRTFTGITGNVSIDEKGDRNADYSILDMTNPTLGIFEPVINYYGESGTVERVADIHWPGGATGPPDDIPDCGFFDEYCPKKMLRHFRSLLALLSASSFWRVSSLVRFTTDSPLIGENQPDSPFTGENQANSPFIGENQPDSLFTGEQ